MKKTILILFCSLLSWHGIFAALPGKYDVIVPNIPPKEHSLERVRVDEVFSFTCSHCYELHKQIPILEEVFGEKLKIVGRPIGWIGQNPGRLYYIGVRNEKGQQIKDRIFSFVFEQGEEIASHISTKEILRNAAILEGLEKEFDALMEDPEIIKKMKDGIDFAKRADINSTPTLVIEGSMKTSRNIENLIKIVNALLQKPVEDPLQKFYRLEAESRKKARQAQSSQRKKKGFWEGAHNFFRD